jgi:hypothetical protein
MKRYVKLFESYVREYAEYQQPDYPESMHGYEGGSSDPVSIAYELADQYGVDQAALDANLNALGVDTSGETEEYGVALAAGIGIIVTTIVGLTSASFLGMSIEATMRNKRWLKAEIEDRVEKAMKDMPDADEAEIMRTVTDEVMNDPEIAEKLQNWKKKDGGAPVHKRYRGPVYSAPHHSFGSGYVGRS